MAMRLACRDIFGGLGAGLRNVVTARHLKCRIMEWSGRAPARQRSKLARGAKDKEHAMSQNLGSAVAVVGIDIGKNSFHVVELDRPA